MLLITSAAYIDGELASEFGHIPPCFLPIGNRRLFQHQIKLAQESGITDIYISLPSDFEVEIVDANFFKKNNIKLIYVPSDISLGHSIAYCWSLFEGKYKNLNILFGDTLFVEKSLEMGDMVFLSKNDGYYERAKVEISNHSISNIESILSSPDDLIVAGFFSFIDGFRLIKLLHMSNYDFIEAIYNYFNGKKECFDILNGWLDLGHVTSYFRSRANMTTQRVFNGLNIDNYSVRKFSKNKIKMKAEYLWFKNIPDDLKKYTPSVYSFKEHDDFSEYSLEYIYSASLSDLAVFSKHHENTWLKIFEKVNEFIKIGGLKLSECDTSLISYEKLDDLYLRKTLSRLSEFSSQRKFDVSMPITLNGDKFPSLIDIAKITSEYISKPNKKHLSIVHGDLCFSNILYNFRSQSIKVLDPRGIDVDERLSILGDIRYEYAKFSHSVVGLYDFIIAGSYDVIEINPYDFRFNIYGSSLFEKIKNYYFEVFFDSNSLLFKEIMAINVHLFLSMLPLHSDDENRQLALMLNGVRLFSEYFSKEDNV